MKRKQPSSADSAPAPAAGAPAIPPVASGGDGPAPDGTASPTSGVVERVITDARLEQVAHRVALGGACGTTEVRTRIQLPAQEKSMAERQDVVVESFAGNRGGVASSQLRQAVLGAGHHRLVSSGGTVVVSGEVAADEYEPQLEVVEESRCVAQTAQGGCTKRVPTKRYRRNDICAVEVRLTATRASTGEVLFVRTGRGAEGNQTLQMFTEAPRENQDGLCTIALGKAVRQLIPFVTSHAAEVSFVFRDVADPGNLTKQAIALVKSGDVVAASGLFRQVASGPSLGASGTANAKVNYASILWALGEFRLCADEAQSALLGLPGDKEAISLKTECERLAR